MRMNNCVLPTIGIGRPAYTHHGNAIKKQQFKNQPDNCDGISYCAIQPPSIENAAPVTKLEALLAR